MATRGKKISEQTLAASLDGNEVIPFAKNGDNGAVKASKIKEWIEPDLSKLDSLPTATELDAALTAKQDKLVNSDDVTIGIDNKLTVTDLAKNKAFIDQCEAEGAVYNVQTGYFELNGLANITTEQMRQILPYLTLGKTRGDLAYRFQRVSIRTITVYCEGTTFLVDMSSAFYAAFSLETIKITSIAGDMAGVKNMNIAFRYCTALRRVDGVFDVSRAADSITNSFVGCAKLQEIRMYGIKSSVMFQYCPLLSVESITYMVENAANTAPITITLHPDAYARLTDEIITAATAKQINFATETA